jgi:hypothetical protein
MMIWERNVIVVALVIVVILQTRSLSVTSPIEGFHEGTLFAFAT